MVGLGRYRAPLEYVEKREREGGAASQGRFTWTANTSLTSSCFHPPALARAKGNLILDHTHSVDYSMDLLPDGLYSSAYLKAKEMLIDLGREALPTKQPTNQTTLSDAPHHTRGVQARRRTS